MGYATLRLPAVMVLVLVLAGCAAGRGDGAGSATTQEETTANSSEETTVYKGETTVLAGPGGIPEPPDSTLSYGGREVKGTLGSYCWSSGNSNVCADGPPLIPSKQKTLTVPPDSEMVFRYGGQEPLNTVQIGARPLGKKGGSHPTLKAHGSGVERTISAKMPPGEYVLNVFVKEQRGDASYYFRVMVK